MVQRKGLSGFFFFLTILAVVLAACAQAASEQPSALGPAGQDTTMEKESSPTKAMMEKEPAATETAMMANSTADVALADTSGDGMMESPAFFAVTLTDPASGQTFRIQDFKGKVVLVETLAMWCPSCLRQQQQVQALHGLLGERDDFLSIGLDVDPNENAEDLKGYVTRNGFDWRYAVAPTDVSNEIASLLGNQFLNPSSTPMFIIDRDGEIHPLPFGVKSAEELQAALQPFLDAGM